LTGRQRLGLLRVFGDVFCYTTHHRVRLNVRKRMIVLKLILEQPTGSYDGFSVTYGKTSHHGLCSCSAWLNRDFDVVLSLIVLRTHFGQSRRLVSSPCRSTLANVRFGRVFTTRTRRISSTATRTLTARRILMTSETVVRFGRVFMTWTRRISPTATRTLTARRILTTSETVVRYGARVHID
jgi:hypothetical protein